MLSPEEQLHILESGVDSIVPRAALLDKLKKGEPLNIKLGVDQQMRDFAQARTALQAFADVLALQ